MEKEIRSTINIIALYTLALVLSSVTYDAIIPDVFPFYGISTVYFLILSVFLLRYFYEKTIGEGPLRRLLIMIAVLIIFWIILRGTKYYLFWESDSIRRHLWYMYYIPQILIPVFTLYSALMIDFTDGMKIKKRLYIPAVVSAVMIIIVLTNDLHQKVFAFNPGFLNWDHDYTYGFIFAPIIIFTYGSFLAAFVVMVLKCHKYYPNKPFWIVILPFFIGTMMLIFSNIGEVAINGITYKLNIIKSSEIQCYMSATFLSACIKIGLIPSNENHARVLNRSSLDISILDNKGDVKYATYDGNVVQSDEDTLIKKYEFKNGHAVWKEDISEINRINFELSQAYEQLSEESELIRLENELKEQNAKVKFRTSLYDVISEKTYSTTEMIYKLAGTDENRKRNARFVCFLGAYLKRYANLTIINENTGSIPVNELYISIKESLKYLNYMGIPCEITMENRNDLLLDGKTVIYAYELFENAIVNNIDSLLGVYGCIQIHDFSDENKSAYLKLNLEGADFNAIYKLTERVNDRAIRIYEEDGITYLNLCLTEGRECYV